MYARRGLWFARALVFALAIFTLMGLATMLLWNAIAIPLFAAPAITFWQALGLMLLGRLISGNLSPRGGRRGFGPWGRHRGGPWRERWQAMSEEERQQVMQRWGGRCGPHPHQRAQDQRTDPNPTISES